MPVQTYLIDFSPQYAASSLAALSFLRSLAGALLPLGGGGLMDKLGLGLGNTVLAIISVVFWPVTLSVYVYGEKLRKKFPIDLS